MYVALEYGIGQIIFRCSNRSLRRRNRRFFYHPYINQHDQPAQLAQPSQPAQNGRPIQSIQTNQTDQRTKSSTHVRSDIFEKLRSNEIITQSFLLSLFLFLVFLTNK